MIKFLNKIINEKKIDYIYPSNRITNINLVKSKNKINAKIISSPLKTLEITTSKIKLYKSFKNKIMVKDEGENGIYDRSYTIGRISD